MKKCKTCNKNLKEKQFYNTGTKECKECTKIRSRINARNITRQCKVCKNDFGTCSSEIKRGRGKFCSRKCLYKWNTKENTYNFKGKNGCRNGYDYIHKWIKEKCGTPEYCEHCKLSKTPKGKARYFHWSNISGKYLEDITDWQRLCVKCHKKYDMDNMKFLRINCVVCKKEILTKSKKRKFCSTRCSSKYYRKF